MGGITFKFTFLNYLGLVLLFEKCHCSFKTISMLVHYVRKSEFIFLSATLLIWMHCHSSQFEPLHCIPIVFRWKKTPHEKWVSWTALSTHHGWTPWPTSQASFFLNIYSSSASVAFVGRESTYFGKKAPLFLKQEFQDLPLKFLKPLV